MSDEPPESSGAVQDIGSSQDSATYLIAPLAKFLESMERELTSLEKPVVPPPLFAIQPLNVFALPLLLSVVPHFRDAYTPHQLCVVFLQVAAVSAKFGYIRIWVRIYSQKWRCRRTIVNVINK